MAGSQQQQILDTIFSMKRRILRKDDSTDDEETDALHNNRQQSLKRKVQYSRAGDSDFLADPRPYKKRIEHAGYRRYILQRNPPRYDPDGDIIELDDEYDDEDDLSTVEENPYADIQIESLLAPLTSGADLPNHPSISVAYTSKHLSNLTDEAGALSRKERITLWRAKNLFTKLQGDSTFAPAALAAMGTEPVQEPWLNSASVPTTNGTPRHHRRPEQHHDVNENANVPRDVVMEDAGQPNGAPQNGESYGDSVLENQNGEPTTNGTSHHAEPDEPHENGDGNQSPPAEDASDTASQQTAHRMTTRARAQAASTPSPPSSPSSASNPIHPLFLFPTDSIPDRDFGLPSGEAEDTRMLLMAYVQKQEEISRVSEELYMGMMQADRMRQEVLKWCKAEAHVGEMSDGEDWYDREEWGLEEDLVKGRDEEEDETAVAGKKSTRQRRTKPDRDDR